MDFEGERYVRLFTRDTPTWVAFKPESRAVLPCLLRKLDKRGRIEWPPKHGTRALAATLGLRQSWVDIALRDLVEHGTISLGDGWLEMPNYVVAQNVRTRARSGAERMADLRDRQRSLGSLDDVTIRDESDSQPSPAQPNQAQQNTRAEARTSGAISVARSRSKPPKSVDPRAVPVLQRIDEHRVRLGWDKLPTSQREDRLIVKRLDEGATLEQLLLIVDIRAGEVERDRGAIRYFNATSPFTGPGRDGPGGWSVSLGMLDVHRAPTTKRPPVIADHDVPDWMRGPKS